MSRHKPFASAGVKLARALAGGLRALPRFRGKGSLGLLFQRTLVDLDRGESRAMSFMMKDGAKMTVDLRSQAERIAFWTGEYDAREITLLKRFLVPGGLVLDVGANVGFYAIQLGQMLRSLGGRLIAFEPVPENFTRLCRHISANNLHKIVQPLAVALGRDPGTARLKMTQADAATGNAYMLSPDEHPPNALAAPLARLDDLAGELDLKDCALIKVDIEGGEYGFFLGAREFLARHRPPILAEFNYFWMKHFGWSADDVRDLLSPLGYQLYRLERRGLSPLGPGGSGIDAILMLQERHRLRLQERDFNLIIEPWRQ